MQVRFTAFARRQIGEIFSYIARDNPRAARKVRQRILQVAELLEDNPEIGRTTSRAGVRVLTVRPYPYLIFYRIADDAVSIVSVRHGARRPAFHEPAREFQL